LEILGSLLKPCWLTLVSAHPLSFACKVYRFDAVEDKFPCLVTGAAPETIVCSSSFAPLMDMRYLCTWRLLLNRILSSTAAHDIACICLFLSRASACLHADTYLELELLPELTPNMALHFKMCSDWPTNSNDPLSDFARSKVTDQIAQTYDCITTKVHPDHPAPAADVRLMTALAASVIRHQALTPKNSLAPADSLVASEQPASLLQSSKVFFNLAVTAFQPLLLVSHLLQILWVSLSPWPMFWSHAATQSPRLFRLVPISLAQLSVFLLIRGSCLV
jgi:hypothetical protein